MNFEDLISAAKNHAETYLKKDYLGADEELQMITCAHSILFLSACANLPKSDFAQAYDFIAQCYERAGDTVNKEKYLKAAEGYKSYFKS